MKGATYPRQAIMVGAAWPLGSVMIPFCTARGPMCTGSPVEPMSANTSAGYPLYSVPTASAVDADVPVFETTVPARPATMLEWLCPSGIARLPDPSEIPDPIDAPSAQTETSVLG